MVSYRLQKKMLRLILEKFHSDSYRNKSLPPNPRIFDYPEPSEPFAENQPTFEELQELVKKSRAASALGPNGIPYKLYKCCPHPTVILWGFTKVIGKKGEVPSSRRKKTYTSALCQQIMGQEAYKIKKTRKVIMLKDSQDPQVNAARMQQEGSSKFMLRWIKLKGG